MILQSAIKRHLISETNLQNFLTSINFKEIGAGELEILGEKAIPAGHIDILLKQRIPLGSGPKIPIEVKTKKAQPIDLIQLRGYMSELRGECPIGVLIAADFHKHVIAGAKDADIMLVRYALAADLAQTPSFEEIYQGLTLESAGA